MSRLISISGYAGSGKDLAGFIIRQICDKEKAITFENKKFAGKLKQIASILTNIPQSNFEDQEFKKTNLGSKWDNMTVRTFLQKLGTEAMRNGLCQNTWLNAFYADFKENSNWTVTDARFINELQSITDNNGITIRLHRNAVGPISNHPSETEQDSWEYDYVIDNSYSKKTLETRIKTILRVEKII